MEAQVDEAELAYEDLLYTAEKRIEQIDAMYNKQDNFRLKEIQSLKHRAQKRIDLQKESGQLLTRIELENVEQLPQCITNPALRRAIRAGNYAPHGSGCSLQATRHSACLLRNSDVVDSIRLTENGKTSRVVIGTPPVVSEAKKRPQELVLEHFKQQIEGTEEVHESADKPRASQNPLPEDIKNNKISEEFLASALLCRLTHDELAELAEQEKSTRLGESYRMQASGTHTISEWEALWQTDNFSPDHESSPKTREMTIENFIPEQSASQLLQSERLATLEDAYNLMGEQQTHVSKSRKRVAFAPSRKGKYLQDDDSDASQEPLDTETFEDELDDFEQIDMNESNQFDDLTDFGAEFSEKGKKGNEISPSSQMIAVFEKLHGIE